MLDFCKDGDIFLVTDAYKHGNERNLLGVFCEEDAVNKKIVRKFGESTQYYLFADESSMRARYGKLQGGYKFNTFEYLHAVAGKDVDVPDKPRTNYQGSTCGDGIGPISYDKYEDMVCTTYELKKKIYGSNIRRVGGASAVAPVDEPTEPRKATTIEPLFYHQYPKALFQEYLYSFACRSGSFV